MSSFIKTNRLVAAVVFALSFLGYFTTVSPTLSYWDCGEFAACAYSLGIPHPPGSPLFLIVGRLFSMLPISEIGFHLGLAVSDYDIAFKVNLISVLASAFAVLFVHLIIVRMLLQWKGRPADTFGSLKITLAAALGALTFAFTYSHWFNAVEAEVYASSTFFTTIVVWLIMVWLEKPDDLHSDVYLLLIAYMIGLAIGVHLLNVLTLPFIFFIIYSKKFDINAVSFAKFIVVGLLAVGVIYKAFLFYTLNIPKFFDGFGMATVSVLLFFGLLFYLTYYMVRENKHTGALIVIGTLLIFVGYSTYAMIMIRSGMNPNIDQNDPDTWASFIKYMNREQYGDFSVWPRIAPFWDYQVNKMFVRYFNWQFVGRPDEVGLSIIDHLRNTIGLTVDTLKDTQEDRYGYMSTVLSWRGLYGLPFLAGLIGAAHHFNRDWKRALAVLGLFVATGIAIIIYLNQPDPQPRERDYSYVGAFFAFSIWIGIGIYAVFEWVEEKLRQPAAVYVSAALIAALLPINMYVYNKPTSSRQGNLVAWDYSYNLLESCEKDAILFTNGDNDTFPLWYLQEVEKVRPDVRIVNLSLLNTEWYINQIKNRSLEYVLKDGSVFKAQTVPIGYSDKEILGDPKVPNSSIQPTRWKARDFSIDIPRDLYWKDWTESGRALPPDADTISIPKMKFRVEPTIQGQGIRVQDMMVLDILFANKFRRPMYYAITVSDDNKVGLGRYLRMDGLAYKLVTVPDTDMSIDHMYENTFKKYKYRNMNRSDVSYDDNIKRLTQNYRTMFLRLVEFYRQQKGTPNPRQTALDKDFPESLTVDQKIVAILDSMSATISEEAIPMRDWRLKLAIGQFYAEAGRPDVLQNSVDEVLANERKYRLDQQGKIRVAALELYVLKNAQQAAELLKPMYESNPSNVEALSYYLQALEDTKQFDEAVRLLDEWLVRNPNDNAAKSKLAEIRAKAGTPQKE